MLPCTLWRGDVCSMYSNASPEMAETNSWNWAAPAMRKLRNSRPPWCSNNCWRYALCDAAQLTRSRSSTLGSTTSGTLELGCNGSVRIRLFVLIVPALRRLERFRRGMESDFIRVSVSYFVLLQIKGAVRCAL